MAFPAWPATLPLPHVEEGRRRTVMPRNEETMMESGRVRARRQFTEPLETMSVLWRFQQEEFEQFRVFFRDELNYGESPFTFVSNEPAPDPSKVRQTTWTVAFLEGRYEWTQTDGWVEVEADLLVGAREYTEVNNPFWVDPNQNLPDLEVDYDSPCRTLTCLKWNYTEGDMVETAWAFNGPWYRYILDPPHGEVWLNNSFNGSRYFRVVDADGEAKTRPAMPLASVVAPPVLSITNVETPSEEFHPLPVCPLAPGQTASATDPAIPRPFSYRENQYVCPWWWYLEPAGRYCVSFVEQGGARPPNIVSVVSEAPGGVTKWTRNGADPTSTTLNPVKNGQADADCSYPTFGLVVRARTFVGECSSPQVAILVDQDIDISSLTRTVCRQTDSLTAGAATALWCCIYVWGKDPTPMVWCIGGPRPSVPPDVCEGVDQILQMTSMPLILNAILSGPYVMSTHWDRRIHHWGGRRLRGYIDETIFPGGRFTGSIQLYESLLPIRYSQWNVRTTECFEYPSAVVTGASNTWEGMSKTDPSARATGAGGSFAGACNAIHDWLHAIAWSRRLSPIDSEVPVPSGGVNQYGATYLTKFSIYLSRIDDIPDLYPMPVPEEPPTPPSPPEPPAPSVDVFGDDFQDYDDGDATEQEMAAGSGWDAGEAWILHTYSTSYGEDGFEDYTDFEDGELDIDEEGFVLGYGGEGWANGTAQWVLRNFGWDRYGYEGWESYEDGELYAGTTLVGGTGWNWLVEDLPELGSESWTLHGTGSGREDWESYEDDADVTTEDQLEWSSDGSWGCGTAGQWYFNSLP